MIIFLFANLDIIIENKDIFVKIKIMIEVLKRNSDP